LLFFVSKGGFEDWNVSGPGSVSIRCVLASLLFLPTSLARIERNIEEVPDLQSLMLQSLVGQVSNMLSKASPMRLGCGLVISGEGLTSI